MGLQRLVVGEVEMAHEDLDARMPHQLLQLANVGAIAQHIDGDGVAEAVRMDAGLLPVRLAMCWQICSMAPTESG